MLIGNVVCNSTALPNNNSTYITNDTCVNWNYYYTECKGQGNNPFQGTISFDNIGLAWVAIFLVSFFDLSQSFRNEYQTKMKKKKCSFETGY